MPNTAERPNACASIAPLRSLLPVSTATTRWTGLVWLATACATRGIHAAPSWATITAVTMSWLCVLSGDTYPLAARMVTCAGCRLAPPRGPGEAGARGEQYANQRGAFRQTPKTVRRHTTHTACPNLPDWLVRQPLQGWAFVVAVTTTTNLCTGRRNHDKRGSRRQRRLRRGWRPGLER